ncbi:MAG: hypothetical protein RLZZ70_236 [Candidatus Parcubacteria bacterium]|jgi:hypothetical protein
MLNANHDEEIEEEAELGDDEEATLADDLLDEVGADDVETDDDLMEGFGILPAAEEEEDDKEEEDDLDTEEVLEEDAEDVDFDRFDDVDEM